MPDKYVEINGKMYKKPTKGRCAHCGSDMLEFYDDGSGICLNCGRSFSWLKPLKEPIKPHKTQDVASPAPVARKTQPVPVYPEEKPVKTGVFSVRAISILGFLGALFIGLGSIILISITPVGSWPPEDMDSDTFGNIYKSGELLWGIGTMLFLMGGLSAAGTKELEPSVRISLILGAVAMLLVFWLFFSKFLAILYFGHMAF